MSQSRLRNNAKPQNLPFVFEFEKYHGLGNDFIFISANLLKQFPESKCIKNFVKRICQRNFSIGADGVVFYRVISNQKSTKHNSPNDAQQRAEVLIINSDGSFAGNCGNALRCLGLLLFRKNKWNAKTSLSVSRLKPPLAIQKTLEASERYLVERKTPFAYVLDLHPDIKSIPISKNKQKSLANKTHHAKITTLFSPARHIESWDNKIQFSKEFLSMFPKMKTFLNQLSIPVFVQLENPHLVFFSKGFKNFSCAEYSEFGKEMQKYCDANISMISAAQKKTRCQTFHLVVYERGAGLTSACGTGAVASALTLEHIGKIDSLSKPMTFMMPGGLLEISREQNQTSPKETNSNFYDKIRLKASAEFIFSARMRVASA